MLMNIEQELEAAIFMEIGFEIEMLGIAAVYFGHFLKSLGAADFGGTIYNFGIGTVAVGETTRKWYDPSETSVKSTRRFPSGGDEWNILGEFVMINRMNIDAYYQKHLYSNVN